MINGSGQYSRERLPASSRGVGHVLVVVEHRKLRGLPLPPVMRTTLPCNLDIALLLVMGMRCVRRIRAKNLKETSAIGSEVGGLGFIPPWNEHLAQLNSGLSSSRER
jgi:hypothetical protein